MVINMKVNDLVSLLDAEIVNLAKDSKITGCYIGDLLSLVMSKAEEGDAWITIQTNVNVAAVSVLVDCAVIIVADNMMPDTELQKKAKEQEVNIIKTEKTAYEIAKIISRAGI